MADEACFARTAPETFDQQENQDPIGAGRRIRTADLLITNQSLYRLSYSGKCLARAQIASEDWTGFLDRNHVR